MNDEPQNYEQKKGDLKFEALNTNVLYSKGSVAGCWQQAPMGRNCEQHAVVGPEASKATIEPNSFPAPCSLRLAAGK
jgi:hypothetical protein